jgi:hypothetical protein
MNTDRKYWQGLKVDIDPFTNGHFFAVRDNSRFLAEPVTKKGQPRMTRIAPIQKIFIRAIRVIRG